MARKIRSFAEYDAVKAEREEEFEVQVESRLERLVLEELKKKERTAGLFRYVFQHPVELVGFVLGGSRELLRISIENNRERFRSRAQREQFLQNFGSNIHDLVRGSVYLSHRHDEKLPEDARQSLYLRFLDELKDLVDKGDPGFKQEYPEASEIGRGFHPPEREEEFERVKKVIYGLQRRKYITLQNAETLIRLLAPCTQRIMVPGRQLSSKPPREEATPAREATLAIERKERKPAEESAPLPAFSTHQDRVEYLTLLLNRSDEMVQRYAHELSLKQLEDVHERLRETVGEEYAVQLLQANPAILGYVGEKLFSKYLKTLREVQERIRRNGSKDDVAGRFGLEKNRERYAHLEQLLELKRELFAATGSYAQVEKAQKGPQKEFDLEEYKNRLLARAGLDIDIVRGFTEGKTAHFKGEMYMPAEYFRKNAAGKVEPAKFSAHWEEVFDEMVRLGAIVRKPKGNPLYRLNPHFGEITNKYLQEYMRLTLHAGQILAQDGRITPLIDLDKEEKP